MPNVGPLELVIVLVVVLLIFGPKRLPMLGRQIGSGFREFKDGIGGKGKPKADATPAAVAPAATPRADEPAEGTTVPDRG